MVDRESLNSATLAAAVLLTYLYDVETAVRMHRQNEGNQPAEELVKLLLKTEEAMKAACLPHDIAQCFAAVNASPVIVNGIPRPSVHDAIYHGGVHIRVVASPYLSLPNDATNHADIIGALLRAYKVIPSIDELNLLSAMRQQEHARAIAACPPEMPTEEPTASPKPRIVVDQVACTVTIDQHTYGVTPNQASIVDALVKADGERVGITSLGYRSRDMKNLPGELAAIIKADQTGTRIPRETLWLT
jgi:hypothetical protein